MHHESHKEFFSQIRGAVMSTMMLAVVCCGIYPLVVFGISQILFRDKANGSLIVDKDGTVRGSKLLGQGFTAEKYFHSRPSAAGNGYDAANSGGSNLGPTSQKLSDAIKERIASYRTENGLKETDPVPADAVTASGSGPAQRRTATPPRRRSLHWIAGLTIMSRSPSTQASFWQGCAQCFAEIMGVPIHY